MLMQFSKTQVFLRVTCGSAVVKATRYKSEGRGFESRWGKLLFSGYLIFPAAPGPGVYSASNSNEYQ
jgi:hypothetical protein